MSSCNNCESNDETDALWEAALDAELTGNHDDELDDDVGLNNEDIEVMGIVLNASGRPSGNLIPPTINWSSKDEPIVRKEPSHSYLTPNNMGHPPTALEKIYSERFGRRVRLP